MSQMPPPPPGQPAPMGGTPATGARLARSVTKETTRPGAVLVTIARSVTSGTRAELENCPGALHVLHPRTCWSAERSAGKMRGQVSRS